MERSTRARHLIRFREDHLLKQVVLAVGDGRLPVVEVCAPTFGPTKVLVATTRSLLSTGTERAVRELASASLLDKARARPDLVRQVSGGVVRPNVRVGAGSFW